MPDVADRFRVVCEMIDIGFEIERQNLRRAHPDWDEAKIESAFRAWRGGARDTPPATK